jgi:hypothetical protein
MMRRTAWALVGLLGCAANRLPPTAHTAATDERPRVDVVDLTRPLRVAERLPDGTILVLCGGLRAELRGGAVTLADDFFNAPVVRALHVAGRWLFVAADGTAARSDSFLGPLRRLETAVRAETVALVPGGDGRASAVDVDGRVVFSDGAGDFAAAPAQPALPVFLARFADPLNGWAQLESDERYTTTDGGRRWRFERGPWDLTPSHNEMGELPPEEDAAARAHVQAALVARNPAFLALLPTTRLPDGSVLVEDDGDLVEISPRGERRVRTSPATLPMLARERHGIDLAGYRVYRADLAAAASLVQDEATDATSVRLGRVGQAQRVVETSRHVTELAGLDERRAWGWADDAETARRAAVSIDLATGRVDDLLPADFEQSCRPGVCEFAPDGTLFAVAAGRLIRVDRDARVGSSMPAGATRVALADAQRGIAYGERRDRVWLTRDGARSWQAVDLGGPVARWSPVDRGATCHPLGCLVAGVAIEGFDAADLRVRSLAVATARQLQPRWQPPWFERAPALRCENESPLELPPWTEAARQVDRSVSPTGEVRCLERWQQGPAGEQASSSAREWRGVDAEGPFHGVSPWAPGRRCGYRDLPTRQVAGFGSRTINEIEEALAGWTSGPRNRQWVRWSAGRTALSFDRLAGGADLDLRGERLASWQTISGGGVVSSPAALGDVLGEVYWISRQPNRARFVPRQGALEGETVDIPTTAALGLCAGPSRREALHIAVPIGASGPAPGWLTVEVADGTACIRDAQSFQGYASLAWPDEQRGLAGVAYGDRSNTRLRCSLVAR